MRVLIADDDPISRHLLRAVLRNWGYEPVLASDGAEAWRILEEKGAPEVAILDWMMPEMDGLEICRRLRRRKTSTPTYAILLTANERPEEIAQGFEAGADDFVLKPFKPHELQARLKLGVRIVGAERALADRARELEAALDRIRQLEAGSTLTATDHCAAGISNEVKAAAR